MGREQRDPKRLMTLTHQAGRAPGVYTNPRPENLGLKLRQQALKQGMIPGSPRWRAYVLGTLEAAKRRKSKKRRQNEGGYVTPPK